MIAAPIAAALAALAAIQATAPPAPDGQPTIETYLSFVAQCRYPGGAKAMLFHRFGSDSFVFAVRFGRDDNLVWRVRPRGAEDFAFEAQPGTDPMHSRNEPAARALLPWLLQRDFRVARHGSFAAELARADVALCPEPYPFVR
jgi:hypothetical protein